MHIQMIFYVICICSVTPLYDSWLSHYYSIYKMIYNYIYFAVLIVQTVPNVYSENYNCMLFCARLLILTHAIAMTVFLRYELRVIVWNTNDVYLQESNLAGENMSDIYVKW